MGNADSKFSRETWDQTDPRFDQDELGFPQLLPVLPPEQEPQDSQQSASAEDENQRRMWDEQNREMEDKDGTMKEERELRDLQSALANYDFKKCPRIKKESYGDLDVWDVDVVRIALIGPRGSGKTSYIGTLQRALGENQSAVGGEEGVLAREYYVQKNIRLVDTRGFVMSDENVLEECQNILSGRIRPGEEVMRSYDLGYAGERQRQTERKAETLAKHAHGVILVVKADASYLENTKDNKTLKKIREELIAKDYDPVTVITGLDNLENEERKDFVFNLVCEACGSSPENTFFVANYMCKEKERSLAVDRTALDILDRALLSAEKFIGIHKQKTIELMQAEINSLIFIAKQGKTRPVHGLKDSKPELITSEGGVVTLEGIQVVCPPEAVDTPVVVEVTLEEPFRYYGEIVNRGLENDVIFASPIIKLQPNGQSFKKAVTVKTQLDGEVTNVDSYRVLHGTQNSEDKIIWQDITDASSFDLEQKEVTVQIDKFSFLTVLKRLTSFPIESITSLLNLFPFTYTLSVLFKINPYSPRSCGELSLVFTQRDIYQNCSLEQLEEEGFQELCFNVSHDSSHSVYNNEDLEVSVHLGEDYQLGGPSELVESDNNVFRIKVDSAAWRSTGHTISLPLQGVGGSELRILCGRVNVKGEYGHFRDGSFCELDTCGYLKRLLGIEGTAVINVTPIAQKLKVPEEIVTKITDEFWHEGEQLDKVLQQWINENGGSKEPAALRRALEGLTSEVYRVKERGQMHVMDLRETARKILELKHEDAEQIKYFANHIQTLLPNLLRDCCIEMATTKDEVEIAASTDDCGHLLEMHNRISEDFANKLKRITTSSSSSLIAAFSSAVPRIIQLIKEIFRERKVEAVQNGLRGLFEETVLRFTDEVRNAEQRKSIPKMLCEVCKILETLCLNNHGSHSAEEIQKWGQSLQSVSLLKLLETFFQSCEENKLYTRLDMFLGALRDIMAELTTVEEMVLRNFYDLSLSLINFAKFDPSKLVRFELTGPGNSSLTIRSEAIKFDSFQDTFSQRFQLRKDTDNCLELNASALVHQQGRVGAFESEILLPASAEPVLDRMSFPVEVKKKPEGAECLRVVLRSTQKENIEKALTLLQKEIEEGVVDWGQTEIKKAPLTVRSIAKAGAVVRLRLVYRWHSHAIGLDSKDFEAWADSNQDPCNLAVGFQSTAPLPALRSPLYAEETSASVRTNVIPDGDADGVDLSPFEVIQRHAHKRSEHIEFHYHNTVVQGHNCVVGNSGTITDQRPTSGRWNDASQRSLTAPPSSADSNV